MMATRKPKVAPSKHTRKEQGTSSSEEIEMKHQGWTDTESHSGSEKPNGSFVSVREAENAVDNTAFIEPSGPEAAATSEFTSRTGVSNDGDIESDVTSDSQKHTKIKRNTVVPTDKDLNESRRGTPDSRKAWTDTESHSGSEKLNGSFVSVREADNAVDNTAFIEQSGPETMTTSEMNSTHDTFLSESTRNGVSNDGDIESDVMSESQKHTKIKRNTVFPINEDLSESRRGTPDSRKDAWEDTPVSSRPSTAPVPEPEHGKRKKRRVTVGTVEDIRERPLSPSSKINKGYIEDGKDAEAKSESSGSQVSLLRNPFSRNTPVQPFVPDPDVSDDITPLPEIEPVANGDNSDEQTISSRSSGVLALPTAAGEQNAYIPLTYAKDCIQKVMDDMKRMKGTHVKIVGQIQEQYKMIEEDSQGQFNQFVITIRDQYQAKVATFRQVIEIHKMELEKTEGYWKNTVESLKEKNKTLLQDKRQLLLKNKDEFTKLEQEKVTAIKNLTNMLDEKHMKYLEMKQQLMVKQERENVLQEEIHDLHESRGKSDEKHSEELEENKAKFGEEMNGMKTKYEKELNEMKIKLEQFEKENKETKELIEKQKEEEMKGMTEKQEKENENILKNLNVLKEENEALKTELETVKKQSVQVVTSAIVTDQVVEKPKKVKEGDQGEGKPGASIISSGEVTKLNKEITKLNGEIMTYKERIQSLEEVLAKNKEKIQTVEDDMKASTMEKQKYENQLASVKQDLSQSRQRSEALHLQLEGLLATVSVNKDDKETENNLMKAVEEKTELLVEVEKLRGEVDEWKERFKKENNEEEAQENDSAEYQQLVEKLAEEEAKVKENETTIAVMTMLKEGNVPESLPVGSLSKDLEDLEERLSDMEDERNQLSLELERLKYSHEDTELRRKESEEKVQDLERELDDVRQELIDVSNIKPTSAEGESIEELSSHVTDMEQELDQAKQDLENEKKQNLTSLEELEKLKEELRNMKVGSDGEVDELRAKIVSTKESLEGEIKVREQQLAKANARVADLEKQLRDNLPVDAAKELETCQAKVNAVEVEKITMTKDMLLLQATNTELLSKVDSLNKSIEANKKTTKELHENNKKVRDEMENRLKRQTSQSETKQKKAADEHNKKIKNLQQRIKELESAAPQKVEVPRAKKDSRNDEKLQREKEKLQSQIETLKKASQDDQQKIKQLEKDLKEAKSKPAGGAEDRIAVKKAEKQIKDLTKQLDMEKKKNERNKENSTKLDEELKELKKTYDSLCTESKSDKTELAKLGVAAKEGLEAMEKVQELKTEVKQLHEENKTLTDNYNSERILRKKYYNMVEDMKGKIRVYCRARPLSGSELERGNHSVIKSPDEYSISVHTARGPKEFQFDQIFTEESTQEKVFEDTFNLVQSAVDGYNVCIFAYGQTGSGKTFTMIGDKDKNFPGIAPRAMERIFALIQENKAKFTFKVSVYMLELYNDRLIDLLAETHGADAKLDIKKDKKGLVFVHGANVLDADSSEGLYNIFEKGSENRHVASTKMNAESSRSHLVLSIVIESTNKTTGSVLKGKLSLVDLAGSERAAKTEASAEQLKEAQSINKSLSALGDVISALSSEQQFIPYRNNKLTMLMQDSLGGNAKTLMFVNISPADYNSDETVTSLTYASRVKLITNDASKNAENKEIVRLKGIIAKLKQGENVDEDEAV